VRLWRRWGWGRRVLSLLFATALVYFVVLVVLGLLQADFDARTFTSESPTSVRLEEGETRNVYLRPEESASLNFDFYPSDLECQMEASGGPRIEGDVLPDERRLVNAWRTHWGVESFTSATSDTFELVCRDMSDRRYPLVLAKPARFGPYGEPPVFGLFLLTIAFVAIVVGFAVGSWRDRSRPSTE